MYAGSARLTTLYLKSATSQVGDGNGKQNAKNNKLFEINPVVGKRFVLKFNRQLYLFIYKDAIYTVTH